MKNIILIASIALNIALGIFCVSRIKTPRSEPDTVSVHGEDPMPDYEITSKKNFEAVYFNRNDSLYKDLWGEAFENEPEKSFLIACSYYYVTKDTSIINDIETSAKQLEEGGLYNRKLRIGANNDTVTSGRN